MSNGRGLYWPIWRSRRPTQWRLACRSDAQGSKADAAKSARAGEKVVVTRFPQGATPLQLDFGSLCALALSA